MPHVRAQVGPIAGCSEAVLILIGSACEPLFCAFVWIGQSIQESWPDFLPVVLKRSSESALFAQSRSRYLCRPSSLMPVALWRRRLYLKAGLNRVRLRLSTFCPPPRAYRFVLRSRPPKPRNTCLPQAQARLRPSRLNKLALAQHLAHPRGSSKSVERPALMERRKTKSRCERI